MFETALEDDEIMTAVCFPVPKRAVYMKFPNPASRYAIVGVMVAETHDGIRVAVTGAASSVFRIEEMETALQKNFTADAIASIALDGAEFNEDIHASAEYRAHLVNVMARRSVTAMSN
jgi:carbon-monoxide dehydrogenase medium subunit